ncbi:uncharacterized protein PHALS_04956 [Plasmopara halstedii]|uniref:Uncharacterized protein n=1 Tax=Plasmopara halstedii TaxID=4781 RepID=A0A0P1A9F7_PLAHL|nr:uncharacterized protein PHALS_04956 [Plasmopara halstedii]CEG37360.1 hypothetical protein PHALS_04956 [Plasmopara halstedii]|eukprot:XP_024573729.1 hypothetical protein PHALS_04956 [Plasmopara halstedii]
MHFPSQVQRQRINSTSPIRSYQQANARDAATPWYIVPLGDEDESQDICVLKMERKGAMCATEVVAKHDSENPTRTNGPMICEAQLSMIREKGREQEQDTFGRKNESRCIFTPVKKARKFSHPPVAARPVNGVLNEDRRPPSSIASGVDLRFFNDGEEILHKSRDQRTKQIFSDQAPHDALTSSNSQLIDYKEIDQTELQQQDCRYLLPEAGLNNRSDSENKDHRAFSTSSREPGRRDFHHRRLKTSKLLRDCGHTTAIDSANHISFNPLQDATPPVSPVEDSPLPFKMSRTEVVQPQLSCKLNRAVSTLQVPSTSLANDCLENQTNLTPSPPYSPPSPSTSSQGSLILGRPPQGWQKNLLLAQRFSSGHPYPGRSPPTFDSNHNDFGDVASTNAHIDSSPSHSSSKTDDNDSIIDAIVPIDAKDRIMAIAAYQNCQGKLRERRQQRSTMKMNFSNSTSENSKTIHQAWVMSSRTKKILSEVSTSKSTSVDNTAKHHDTRYIEMESVAVYMYTLVQCYKSDEIHRSPANNLSMLSSESTALHKF